VVAIRRPAQRARTLPRAGLRNRERQPATAEVERAQALEAGRLPARGQLEALLLEHVQAHQSQVADVLAHQIGNVIVAHEQHIERQVLAVTHQLVLAA